MYLLFSICNILIKNTLCLYFPPESKNSLLSVGIESGHFCIFIVYMSIFNLFMLVSIKNNTKYIKNNLNKENIITQKDFTLTIPSTLFYYFLLSNIDILFTFISFVFQTLTIGLKPYNAFF